MTTLFKLQFSLLAFSIIRSLASTSPVERDNLVAIQWRKGILKVSLEDSIPILDSAQDRFLYLKHLEDLYELPVSIHEAFPRLMVTQDCSADDFDSIEQWKINFTMYLDNIRRGNASNAHKETMPSIMLAICPQFQNLSQFEKTIRLISDLNVQHNFPVSSILLNFGALRTGQVNALHIIQYVQAAKTYERHGNYTTGLLFEARICLLMTAETLSYQLGEISNTEIYLEEPRIQQVKSNFSFSLECLHRLGLTPAYLLPSLRLFVIKDYLAIEDLHLHGKLPDSTVPLYNLVEYTDSPDKTWLCPVKRKLPKAFPADFSLSIDYSDFLIALDHANVTISFSEYNATFLDAYRKFMVQFENFPLAKSGLLKVLTKVLEYFNSNPTEYFTRPLSLWISFIPSGDLSAELQDLLENVIAARNQVQGLLSHILIDYGPLRVTSEDVSFLRRDIETCNNILKPNNLSCGFIFHYRNCLSRLTTLKKLPFDKHNIIILRGFTFSCSQQLIDGSKLGFTSGLLTIDFTAKKSTQTRHSNLRLSSVAARKENNAVDLCTPIDDADIFLYSAVVLNDNTNVRDTAQNYDPNANWLTTPFKFKKNTGFTMKAVEVQLFSDIPTNVVLLDEFNPAAQAATVLNIANNISLISSSRCSYGVSVTFAVRSNIQDEYNRLNILFENLESVMTISPATCFTVLLDWSPSYLRVGNNDDVADVKLVERMESFLHILEYAQKKSNETDILLDVYVDNLFLRAHDLMFNGKFFSTNKTTKLWKSAFPRVNFILYRVETSLQSLLRQNAYKTAKVAVVEMESAFQSVQLILVALPFSEFNAEQLGQIAFQITLSGCSGPLNLRQLTEIVKFWEIINNWAVYMGATVIIVDSAVWGTTTQKCQLSQTNSCSCGWWVNDEGSLTDLKTLAYNISQRQKSNILPVAPLTPTTVVISCSLMFVLATVFVVSFYYWRRLANKMVLTREQVTELLKGQNIATTNKTSKQFVYEKSKAEVKHRDIRYDKNNVIGAGESGTIIACGTLRCYPDIEKVAVKVFKLETGKQFNNLDYSAIKSLISEANILNFLGEHENLIKLYGACTTNLRIGEMVLVLEYCPYGSLDKLLRHMNPTNGDQSGDSAVSPECRYEGLPNLISKWSFEIANGMEYLASKSVVHGDLAARNILLDSSQTVKISDFGLSRVRSNDGPYIKEGLEPLPWRWMPPEALKMSIFNEKTDVWSFGITLWEMHTFGEIPYGGTSWNPSFIQMVDKGMRPEIPDTVPVHVMNLITACWKLQPIDRPTFQQCTHTLPQ